MLYKVQPVHKTATERLTDKHSYSHTETQISRQRNNKVTKEQTDKQSDRWGTGVRKKVKNIVTDWNTSPGPILFHYAAIQLEEMQKHPSKSWFFYCMVQASICFCVEEDSGKKIRPILSYVSIINKWTKEL